MTTLWAPAMAQVTGKSTRLFSVLHQNKIQFYTYIIATWSQHGSQIYEEKLACGSFIVVGDYVSLLICLNSI